MDEHVSKQTLFNLFAIYDAARTRALQKSDIFDRVETLDETLHELLSQIVRLAR